MTDPRFCVTGAYPCLAVKFRLKRDIGFYMIQLYVPSVLIGKYFRHLSIVSDLLFPKKKPFR